MQVSTVGLDIAKHVFQVHGVDEQGRTVLRRKVSRGQLPKLFAGLEPCLVASRRARRHTTGLANWALWGTRSG
jgi:transposase